MIEIKKKKTTNNHYLKAIQLKTIEAGKGTT